jgi:hypothetical protein
VDHVIGAEIGARGDRSLAQANRPDGVAIFLNPASPLAADGSGNAAFTIASTAMSVISPFKKLILACIPSPWQELSGVLATN